MPPFHEIFGHLKSVLILGFGREGRSSYAFLKKHFPHLDVGIADGNGELDVKGIQAELHLGAGYLKALGGYDLILKSPGVRIENVDSDVLKSITSQTGLFLKAYGSQTIGVSGTKGKSTTVSLIYHLLQQAGHKAVLLGNIGLPAFDFIDKITPDTTVVYELSAHQLEMVHHSPHWAVLLNIFPEHLDYFGSYAKYRQAKLNLFRSQKPGDFAFCGEEIKDSKVSCSTPARWDRFRSEQLLRISGLRGEHNVKNILLAFKVLESMGVPLEEMPGLLRGFHTLPHRLEFVGTFGGISFYNDSISTVPQSTLAAVKSIPETDTLILGGFDRGLDYKELVAFLMASKVEHFFFLGKAGDRMFELFGRYESRKKLFRVKTLDEIFVVLKDLPEASCCLLSPAAASYDQFHNFEHRGDRFKELAKNFSR